MVKGVGGRQTRPHRTQRLDWTRNFSERPKTLPFITSRRYRRRKVFFFLFLLLFHPPPSFSHFPTTPTGAGVKCLAGFYFPLRRPNNIFGCLVCVCMLCEPFLLYDGHLFTTPHLLPPPCLSASLVLLLDNPWMNITFHHGRSRHPTPEFFLLLL
jgi:hypothetical protein